MGDGLVFLEIYAVLLLFGHKKHTNPIYFLRFVCYNQSIKQNHAHH